MRTFRTALAVTIPEDARDFVYRRALAERTPEQALDFVMDLIQHHTQKSGALLGAQGIFALVGTYAIDHGWPRPLSLAAMLLLLVAALLVMSTLKSTGSAFLDEKADLARSTMDLLMGRIARYNVALYLTFASVVLLAIATVSLIGSI